MWLVPEQNYPTLETRPMQNQPYPNHTTTQSQYGTVSVKPASSNHQKSGLDAEYLYIFHHQAIYIVQPVYPSTQCIHIMLNTKAELLYLKPASLVVHANTV